MLEQYRGSGPPDASLGFAFREVCRSILNPSSLRFVVANAPSEVVNSFQVRQQRLASFSLHIASTTLVRQLLQRRESPFTGSLSRVIQAATAKTKSAFLLVACTFGRLSLSALRTLRLGIPRHVHVLLSANILRNLGNLLIDADLVGEPIKEDLLHGQLEHEDISGMSIEKRGAPEVADDILRALHASLPNDLSRLIFLATLRDNNSGHYYHPEVARRFSPEIASCAMLACHRHIYQQVVWLTLEDLTDQLDTYMTTVRAPRKRLIESWTKLQAYRATIPIDTDPISAEIFFMKVSVAVAILGARLPGKVQ